MPAYQFDDDRNGSPALSFIAQITAIMVRLMGIGLLVVGLWVGIQVIMEAWTLYHRPESIERLAQAIDRGSNLDKLLAPRKLSTQPAGTPEQGAEPAIEAHRAAANDEPPVEFRLSYFLAWVIAILMLLLVGRLAMGAVKTGGELALYDTQVKRFARAIIEETRTRGAR